VDTPARERSPLRGFPLIVRFLKVMFVNDLELATTVIQPSSGWPSLGWRELRDHRELLFFLVWRDIKVRYKQAALGAAWALLQPVLSMVIFTVIFGRLAKIPTEGVPYPVFVLSALIPWTYFSNALTGAGNSLIGSANLITKVYFPRLFIPAAPVVAGLLDLAIALPVLVAMMLWYGIVPGAGLLVLPLLLLLACALALGTGLWLAALNVRYRDVRYAIPFLIQVWMFATPVVYPLGLASGGLRRLLAINPMAGVIEGCRAALLGGQIPWEPIGFAALATAVVCFTGLAYFKRVERGFADII